jgi:predicted phage terminase large subunit-like protein
VTVAWELVADQLRAIASPGAMAQWVFPNVVQTPALDLIDEHLVRVATTPSSRLILSMPPQEGKSQRVSRDFPLWALKLNPMSRVILGSYGQDLASRNAASIRGAIRVQPKLGLRLALDNRSRSDWRLDNHIGGVRAVGVGSGVVGHAADLLIVDDPIKSKAEADSPIYRERVWDWWEAQLVTRLAPEASAVVIMTRWHDDDLAGRLMLNDPGRWTVLNIAAQCVDPENDPLGRAEGQYMVSTRGRTAAQWDERKREVGSATWQAQYQGDPVAASGDIFKREWWQRWTALPVTRDVDGRYWLTGFDKVICSWDLTFKGVGVGAGAAKTGDKIDWTVGQVWAKRGAHVFLVDQVRGQWEFPEQLRQVRALAEKWPQAVRKLVEDKANGSAVLSSLRSTVPGFVPITPTESKVVRASVVAPFVEAGNVFVPAPDVAPWADVFIDEVSRFPSGIHDDQVDPMTQALTDLYLGTAAVAPSRVYNIG